MSIVAERRRTWLLPAGISLAVAIAASAALLLLAKHAQTTTSAQPFTAAPAAEQAKWEVKTFAAGAIAKVAKADKAAADKQLGPVEHLVRDVYDTQLMDPKDLPKVLQSSFTRAAATTFEKAHLGVPKGATDVRSTTRKARIGVNVAGAKSAAAEVTISLVGNLKGEKLRLQQHSTLWMERLEGKWQVVGYDVSQGPTNRAAGDRHAKGNGSQTKGSSK